MTSTPFTVRNASDLLALTPLLLGFQPRDSVVVLTFGSPAGSFHARVDLPLDAEGQQEVTSLVLAAALRNRAETAAVLVYSTDVEASRGQARRLVRGLQDAGLDVLDVLRVEEDRYHLALEDDPVGTPYDVSTHPLTAQRVFEGHVVQPSREALADTLVGTDTEDREAVAAAAEGLADADDAATSAGELGAEARWVQRCVRAHVTGGLSPDVDDAARLLVACARADLRDVAWAGLDRDSAAAYVDLWRDLVRRAPERWRAPVAAQLALAAWLAGDGALAWCAVDRCLEVDPDHSLAHQVAELLTNAVPPSEWKQAS